MEKDTVCEATEPGARAGAQSSFRAEVRAAIGLNPASCYQCGKCSAGCPMGPEMTLMPHEMIRLVQLDLRERLMQDESMWLCLTCETCTARCPNEFDPARMIDGLRELSLKAQAGNAPRRVQAFHRSFLDQIRTHGRVFELGLVMAYKLRSGALFDDVMQAPGMLLRGKLKLVPHTIEGIDDVRRLFEACEALEER